MRALRHRTFRALWVGQTVSVLGDSIHRLALVWWVLQTTGSGLAMGTVMICSMVPMVPFLLLGGALVDRFEPVRLMLYSDIVRCVITTILTYLIATDRLELWHLYVFATVFGTVASFFYPAAAKLTQLIVPKEDLPSANSLRSLSQQGASVVGPMVAALVISVGHSALGFAIDAATFAISALCLLPLLRRVPQDLISASTEGSSVLADVRDGFAYVRGEPWLWISIVAFFLITPTLGPVFAIVLPYMITQVNHQGAVALGLVDSCCAAGTVAAAVWTGRRKQFSRRGLVIYGWVIAVAAVSIAFGLRLPTYVTAALAALFGFGNALFFLVWTNLMQDRVPAAKYGRAASIDMMGAVVLVPVGMAVVGWGIDRLEPLTICAIAGGLAILASVLALLHPRIREID